jgi:hypothetical protein
VGIDETGSIGAKTGLHVPSDLHVQGSVDLMLGMAEEKYPVFKSGKASKFGFGLKEYFQLQPEISLACRLVQCISSRLAYGLRPDTEQE